MTLEEFLSSMKKNGANFAEPSTRKDINLANITLQKIQAAMLPSFIIKLYEQVGGINLGNGYIFGPTEFSINGKFPVPDIAQVNKDLSGITRMRGKTVFGRNDLFWFAFDSFGACMMLDNMTLNILRQYDDSYKALTDCLIAGKN